MRESKGERTRGAEERKREERREKSGREPALKVDDFGSPPMPTMDAQVEVTAAVRRQSCGKDEECGNWKRIVAAARVRHWVAWRFRLPLRARVAWSTPEWESIAAGSWQGSCKRRIRCLKSATRPILGRLVDERCERRLAAECVASPRLSIPALELWPARAAIARR